jgi:hypothetical protein
MPIDYNFEHTPSFRDLTQAGILLVRQPFIRSLDKLRQLRAGVVAQKMVPVAAKTSKRFRRSS